MSEQDKYLHGEPAVSGEAQKLHGPTQQNAPSAPRIEDGKPQNAPTATRIEDGKPQHTPTAARIEDGKPQHTPTAERIEDGTPQNRSPRPKKPEKLVGVKPIKEAKHSNREQAKRRRSHPLSMNLFFALIIVAELTLIIGSSSGVMNIVRSTIDEEKYIPDMLWLGAICVAIGAATILFLIRFFSSPIFTLGNAVNKVADGDFSVRLNEKKGFAEIRRINSNFNKMVEELSATEILQTDFVSNVSHEFKTPITAIEGYATLLGGSEGTTPEQAEYIEKILFNTRRLSALVGNILLLSKVDNQTIPNKKTVFRLDEQVRQALLSHETAWTEKDVELDVELDEVNYFGNEPLLFHVWSNLIGNAIKFGPKFGKVAISLKENEKEVLFSVSDEGEGVSDEAKKHIFDRFYQTDSSHKSEGNGLGLALVKQIVKLEGGSVCVSDAELGGAKFTVTLQKTSSAS